MVTFGILSLLVTPIAILYSYGDGYSMSNLMEFNEDEILDEDGDHEPDDHLRILGGDDHEEDAEYDEDHL
jgi:hypothetical protein